jgi:DNA-binding transcriptional LysR family regulator
MLDPLNGVDVFLACVETGGFSAAGRRLGLTRSAVGKTIARLEAQLGVRLFNRNNRTTALTEEGEAYYERSAPAVAELKAAQAAILDRRKEPAGLLAVTVPVLLGRRCVAPLLFELAGRHPGIRLQVAFTDRNLDLVENGHDLAIRVGRLQDLGGLMTRRLGGFEMMLCAAPDYLRRRGRPSSPCDMAGHDLLLYGRRGWARSFRIANATGGWEDSGGVEVMRLDDVEALGQAAIAGLGVAWLPGWLVSEHLVSGALERLLPTPPGRTLDVHALWSQGSYTPLRLRVALDHLAEGLPARMLGPT